MKINAREIFVKTQIAKINVCKILKKRFAKIRVVKICGRARIVIVNGVRKMMKETFLTLSMTS